MALIYSPSPASGRPVQGELLQGVWEHRVLHPSIAADAAEFEIESIEHPLVVVMTADCDIEQDFNERNQVQPNNRRRIGHIFLCDGYSDLPVASDLRRRAKQNQDERYHFFAAAGVGAAHANVADTFFDFLRTVAVPADALYAAIDSGGVARLGVVPPIYLHDLMHRFFGFHSRIAIPD